MMLKTLVKKQLLELFQTYVLDRKTGRARSRSSMALVITLAILLFGGLGCMFFMLSGSLASALLGYGVDWLYFTIVGLCAIAMGVFGSVFNTYGSMYLPKDNEFMLSLPIPTHPLLLSRLSAVYAASLLYSAWLWIPAVLAYWALAAMGEVSVTLTPACVVACVLMTFVIALFVTVISSALGRFVAFIASKSKGKSFVSLFFGLLVLGLYWFAYVNLVNVVNYAAEHVSQVGDAVQSWLHFSYTLGLAAQGDLPSLLLAVMVTLILAGLCYLVLAMTFEKAVISAGRTPARPRRQKVHKSVSRRRALMRREFAHFTSSPTWMLNCGFGLMLLPVSGIASLLMRDSLRESLAQVALEVAGLDALLPVLLFAVLATVISINAITCASVSLEGKSIWIAQSLPVEPWEMLRAKRDVAALLNSAAALFAAICLGIAFQMSVASTVFVCIATVLYAWFHASMGLMIDLRHANLNWTDETFPVKRSISVLMSLLIGWAFCCVAVIAGCLFSGVVGSIPILIGLALVISGLGAGTRRWLQGRGAVLFATL